MDLRQRVLGTFKELNGGMRLMLVRFDGLIDDSFPKLNYRTGRYDPAPQYNVDEWEEFPWAGFFLGRLWLLYDYFKDAELLNRGMAIAHQIGPRLAERALPFADAGAEIYYGLCLGYEATGETKLRDWALAAVENLMASYNPRLGAILQRRGETVSYIDQPFTFQCCYWAGRFDEKWIDPVRTCNETILRCGLIRPDGSTFHAVELDPESGATVALKTRQGRDDNSTWTRGQAWGIHNFTNAFEALGDERYFDAALKLLRWYAAHIPSDYVPYYDFDDPETGSIPRDSCSAALVSNAIIRLIHYRPELNDEFRPLLEGTLDEILRNYLAVGGTLLHGSWGRVRGASGIGAFPQEDIMPYGNYWIAETLYRFLKDSWRLFRTSE